MHCGRKSPLVPRGHHTVSRGRASLQVSYTDLRRKRRKPGVRGPDPHLVRGCRCREAESPYNPGMLTLSLCCYLALLAEWPCALSTLLRACCAQAPARTTHMPHPVRATGGGSKSKRTSTSRQLADLDEDRETTAWTPRADVPLPPPQGSVAAGFTSGVAAAPMGVTSGGAPGGVRPAGAAAWAGTEELGLSDLLRACQLHSVTAAGSRFVGASEVSQHACCTIWHRAVMFTPASTGPMAHCCRVQARIPNVPI